MTSSFMIKMMKARAVDEMKAFNPGKDRAEGDRDHYGLCWP